MNTDYGWDSALDIAAVIVCSPETATDCSADRVEATAIYWNAGIGTVADAVCWGRESDWDVGAARGRVVARGMATDCCAGMGRATPICLQMETSHETGTDSRETCVKKSAVTYFP